MVRRDERSVSSKSEWILVRLDQVASRGSGHTPSKRRPEYWDGAVPWISLADTARLDKGLVETSAKTITPMGVSNSAAVIHPAGTVILLRGSSVGKSAVLASNMAVSQDYVTWTCGPRLHNWYLYYVLQSRKAEFSRIAFGNTIKTIGLDYFRHFEIPLPPIGEQKAIATALLDADRLITALERLLAKKQAMKQGMLQALLTGSIRLPGFVDDWMVAKVGDLLEFKNGLNKSSEYFGIGTPIVNFMDVMSGPIITANDVHGRVTLTRGEIKRFSARSGDLFFTRTSETVEEVGTAAVLLDDVPDASFSGFILRGRPRAAGFDPRFVAHAFQLGTVREQVTSTATYTTRALTNGRSLSRVTIELPPADEQTAIANIIADTDRELASLRRRIEKAGSIKTGMLQQLLTGRRRITVKENAP
ncbi:restriction endonuclease subunit S [Micromonospora costi]|uniref:restriction endonuclease subunit S n=1 Tax=Micromonospora costi TaxID=1530042 RepID=UPI0033E0BEA1